MKIRNLNKVLILIYVVLLLLNLNDLKVSGIIFLLLILPYLLNIFIKIKDKYIFMYYLFMLLSVIFGQFYRFYCIYWFYDKIVHFISGILTSFISIDIANFYKINNNVFKVIFVVSFTSFVAVIWEIVEYIVDLICETDLQWFHITGINDTMVDMIVAIVASILFAIIYVLYKMVGGSYGERKEKKCW